MFLDEVTIQVRSGHGGPGCVSFLRERFRPRGGPDGGNGGKGGCVWLVAESQRTTLVDYRYNRRYRAEDGKAGGPNNRTGAGGSDLVLEMPPGTLIYDAETGHLIADLAAPGERVCVAKGGRGGRGNASFASSRNRAPRQSGPGGDGVELELKLELKLLADVGLIGMPNAGKSTLISHISNARPKVADYPFTTLTPNLGVVERGLEEPFVVADVPGLIEGAADGQGLGHRFLRHVERTRLLVHLLDPVTERDPLEDYRIIRRELERYHEALGLREEIIVINKADACEDPEQVRNTIAEAIDQKPAEIFIISAATGLGVDALVHEMAKRITRKTETA